MVVDRQENSDEEEEELVVGELNDDRPSVDGDRAV